MKKERILQLAVLSSVMAGLSTQAQQVINTGQNPSSPYYADFNTDNLNVSYDYLGSVSGVETGEFQITGTGSDTYTDGKKSPGTGNGTGAQAIPFTGSYTLTAWVDFNSSDNQWEVFDNASKSENSTFTVNGYLPGVSPADGGTDPSELLLSANLKTGLNTLGFGASGSKIFDFLFTTSGGDTKILQDFFGANTGQGAIILNAGTYITPGVQNGFSYAHYFSGNLNESFSNTGPNGTADSFVPEPVAYPVAASAMAFLGFAGAAIRRKRA